MKVLRCLFHGCMLAMFPLLVVRTLAATTDDDAMHIPSKNVSISSFLDDEARSGK